jgi:magnesium-transporting ATPase (P-type)
MFFLKQHKMSIAFMIVLLLFFVLASGVTVARADGEEPFIGKITAIDTESITVRVIDSARSTLKKGNVVKLMITEETRILRFIDKQLESVSLKDLHTGDLVQIKPNTLSDEDVEAESIEIIKGAR